MLSKWLIWTHVIFFVLPSSCLGDKQEELTNQECRASEALGLPTNQKPRNLKQQLVDVQQTRNHNHNTCLKTDIFIKKVSAADGFSWS